MDALGFFFKLLLELSVLYLLISAAVGVMQSYFSTERLERLARGRHPIWAVALTTGLGAVTPFCSCSTVPLASGMIEARLPLAAVASFLVISPLVNPAAIALLATLASPLYAAVYLLGSLFVALLTAWVLARFGQRIEPKIALPQFDDLGMVPLGMVEPPKAPSPTLGQRLQQAGQKAWGDYRKLALIFGLAAAIGALLHGQVPAWVTQLLTSEHPLMVPLAALLGLPIYASTALLLPVGVTLFQQGVNLGVVTAFLMGATGFSVPEGIMLSKIIGPRNLGLLAAAFACGVILIGYSLQWLS